MSSLREFLRQIRPTGTVGRRARRIARLLPDIDRLRPARRRRRTDRATTGREAGDGTITLDRSAPLDIDYSPILDGNADPGEVVWTWIPYEEDPSNGKDRPVVIIGRSGSDLVAVPLTTKQYDDEPQVGIGSGEWDRRHRNSYARIDRVMRVDPDSMRREGAVLDRNRFDRIVAAVEALYHVQRESDGDRHHRS